MNTSLRDQLLAAGLVSEKQARQARQQEQQRQFRDKPKLNAGPPPAVRQAQVAKAARDQELNRRQQDKAQRRARIAQIEQLIEQNRVPRIESDDHYSFIDGKKIRRMAVDAQRREQLTRGELAIVRYKGHYAVVPPAIAERIRERDANMVVPHLNTQTAAAEPDDAYKDFVVPDDLMW
jgi:uncharacterized protein YaiL (DUF2058 family)